MADETDFSRRRFLKSTGAVGASTAVASFGIDTKNQVQKREKSDRTLQLTTGKINTFDPINSTETNSGEKIQQIFDCLTNYPNGEPTPENLLLKEFSIENAGTKIVLTLKQGVKFHDNYGEVTANDVVYSFRRLAESPNTRRSSFILNDLGVVHETDGEEVVPGSLGVEATGKYEVTVKLKQPFHATFEILAYNSFSIVPEGIVGDIQGYSGDIDYEKFSQKKPVGCGPFKIKKHKPDCETVVERFSDYHGKVAEVAEVKWTQTGESYELGLKDYTDYLTVPDREYDPSKIKIEKEDAKGRQIGKYGPLKNGETVQYMRTSQISTFYQGFNMLKVPKPVRKSFAHITDQPGMAADVRKNRINPAYFFTPPGIFPGGADNYKKKVKNSYPYGQGDNAAQIEKAKQVMENTGYGENNRYSLTVTTPKSNVIKSMINYFGKNAKNAYIDVNVEQMEWTKFLNEGREGKLDSYWLGWVMDYPSAANFLALLNPPQTDTSKDTPRSWLNWNRAKDSTAAEKAKNAWDTIQKNPQPTQEAKKKRKEAYIKIEEANWEDVGFIPHYHEIAESFRHKRIGGPWQGSVGRSNMKFNKIKKTSDDSRASDEELINAIAGEDNKVGFKDIQKAITYWSGCEMYPKTGRKVDFDIIQKLITRWISG